MQIEFNIKVLEVQRRGAEKIVVLEAGGQRKEIAADHILVAAGRAPNSEGLGLEAAGVKYSRKGVEVDDELRTSNPKVYACGDIASRFQFTHIADAQARVVIGNALPRLQASAAFLMASPKGIQNHVKPVVEFSLRVRQPGGVFSGAAPALNYN